MPAKIYYDQDADLGLLKGKRIGIIGYGSQGHAHALNLKDSGQDVSVGLYKGSKSWAKAALQSPVLSKALTRFRIPWRWNGGPALLQSRATDETSYVQPTREKMIAARGNRAIYHSNAITTWGVSDKGEVKHVYA